VCRWIYLPVTGVVVSLAELILVLFTNFYVKAFLIGSGVLIASLFYMNDRYKTYNRYYARKDNLETRKSMI